MKRAIGLLLVASLAACSTTQRSLTESDVNVKETRLATDFKREGVRVTYTMFSGEVEKIEAFGYAPVWRGEYRIAAEADAKDKMVKFLRGESVDSTRMTKVIAKSMERSQDNSLNKMRTVDGKSTVIDTTSEDEVDKQAGNDNGDENSKENSALRKASVNNARIVTSQITVTARGNLNAVYKERGYTVDDGKYYVAVYVWTPKQQKAARYITSLMDGK